MRNSIITWTNLKALLLKEENVIDSYKNEKCETFVFHIY